MEPAGFEVSGKAIIAERGLAAAGLRGGTEKIRATPSLNMKWRYCNSGYLLSSAAFRNDAEWDSAAVQVPFLFAKKRPVRLRV